MFKHEDIVIFKDKTYKIVACSTGEQAEYLLEDYKGELAGWFSEKELIAGIGKSCYTGNHDWNDFGSINTWCLNCDIDGEWDRVENKYKVKS